VEEAAIRGKATGRTTSPPIRRRPHDGSPTPREAKPSRGVSDWLLVIAATSVFVIFRRPWARPRKL